MDPSTTGSAAATEEKGQVALTDDNNNNNNNSDAKQMSAADTCRRVAAIRAVDSALASNPYSEPLAEILGGDEQMQLVKKQTSNDNDGVNPVVVRAMMLDRLIQEFCNKHSTTASEQIQFVLLGAGMDTHAYRLSEPLLMSTSFGKEIKWFEVDQEEVISLKEELLTGAGVDLKFPCSKKDSKADVETSATIERISLDLATQLKELLPNLETCGYQRTSPTLFIMEGLLYYIDLPGITKLLQSLPKEGHNEIVFTMIDKDMTDHFHSKEIESQIPMSIVQNFRDIWKTNLSDILNHQDEIFGDYWVIQQQIATTDEEQVLRLVGVSVSKGGFRKGKEIVVCLVPRTKN